MRAYPKGRPYKPEEQKIAEIILGSAVIGTSILVSPLAGASLFFLGVGAASHLFRKRDFNREAKRLQKKGYVALTKTKKGWLVRITKKGQQALQKVRVKNIALPSPKIWDGKWRLFVFDVPERHRYSRDAIRQKLKKLGMYNLQRSVLAYPHGCQKELEQIAEYYMLDEYYTYVETNYIDIDKELRRYFHL